MSKVMATIKLFNAEGRELIQLRWHSKYYKALLRRWKESYPAFTTYEIHIIPDTGEETIIKKAA